MQPEIMVRNAWGPNGNSNRPTGAREKKHNITYSMLILIGISLMSTAVLLFVICDRGWIIKHHVCVNAVQCYDIHNYTFSHLGQCNVTQYDAVQYDVQLGNSRPMCWKNTGSMCNTVLPQQ